MKKLPLPALSLPVLLGLPALLAAGAATGAQAAPGPDLAVLTLLSGCWRGEFGGGGVIEEFYTAAEGGMMLGTTRYLRDGQVVQFEFTRIGVEGEQVVLVPYPGGRPSEHGFALTSFDGSTAIFEAPEHDYPKRIVYRADSDDNRTVQVDAGPEDPAPRSWKMTRVPCAVSEPR